MLICVLTLFSLVISIVQGQLISPCPEVLKYEQRNPDELDRWYGEITLSTSEQLEGVWLKIILDRKADLLGNWFADSVSSDNTEFSLRNPSYILEAGPPVLVRFFVKYNAATTVPTVKKILLNGKQICPSKSTTTSPPLHISKPRHPTSQPSRSSSTTSTTRASYDVEPVDIVPNGQVGTKRPGLSAPTGHRDDGDFFPSDFYVASSEKPTSRPVAAPAEPVQCGTIAQRASPLISHGQNTTPGQWPWHAALYHLRGTELLYTCGGTLISDRFVVTAAHCVTKPRTNILVDKDRLVVYLGKYSLVSFGSEVQDSEIDRIILHPEFNNTVYYNDIALLKLTTPLLFNDFVRPCCLWEDGNKDIEGLVGVQGTVVGWGFDENKRLSKNLMQAQMPIVSTRTCLFSNRVFFSQFIFDKNFCAGFKNGTSVCNGDSGGGMVVPRPSKRGENPIWQLRGIVSVGVALQTEGLCDPHQFIVFTDAAKYVDWIKEVVSDGPRRERPIKK